MPAPSRLRGLEPGEVERTPRGVARSAGMPPHTLAPSSPAPPGRRARTFTVLTVALLLLYGLWTALIVAARLDLLPAVVSDVGRFGMLANILASMGLAAAWVFGRREGRRPGKPQRVPAMRVADLTVAPASSLSLLEGTNARIRDLDAAATVDAVALVRELISSAFSVGASDIHLTPDPDGLRIVFRVDGILHDVGRIARRHRLFVTNRVKVMARLSIHVRAKPQDGRIAFDMEDYQARVSTLPTNHGESVVIRLAVNDEARYDLGRIGFDEETLTVYKTLLSRDHGVIYLTGPTGSGKTTTMYASMQYIRDTAGEKVNMVTLEDPIEVDFRGISQTQVDNAVGLTFALGLRSVLRQDPDVIMVGEIRDDETAHTAIRAGLTGHLLLTSVHADSTVGVFHRLRQLGVDPFQLAGASIAVVNQRLAIQNCADCTGPVEITDLQKKQLELLGVPNDGPFFAGKGCEACRGKGRRGRLPLLEVLRVSDTLRDHIIADTPKHKLLEAAVEEGMRTLSMQATERATEGQLPVDEIIRVLSL